MSRVEWDFSRLPESEHPRVLALLERGKYWELVLIHDQYGLSDNSYCCSNTLKGVKTWFEYGVKEGFIKGPDTWEGVKEAPEVRGDDVPAGG